MEIDTDNLIGPNLDWAVAKCEGHIDDCNSWLYESTAKDVAESGNYHPSQDWAIGGPIIEYLRLCVTNGHEDIWLAYSRNHCASGPTPLLAAMRCYVAMEVGAKVDVPNALVTKKDI